MNAFGIDIACWCIFITHSGAGIMVSMDASICLVPRSAGFSAPNTCDKRNCGKCLTIILLSFWPRRTSNQSTGCTSRVICKDRAHVVCTQSLRLNLQSTQSGYCPIQCPALSFLLGCSIRGWHQQFASRFPYHLLLHTKQASPKSCAAST